VGSNRTGEGHQSHQVVGIEQADQSAAGCTESFVECVRGPISARLVMCRRGSDQLLINLAKFVGCNQLSRHSPSTRGIPSEQAPTEPQPGHKAPHCNRASIQRRMQCVMDCEPPHCIFFNRSLQPLTCLQRPVSNVLSQILITLIPKFMINNDQRVTQPFSEGGEFLSEREKTPMLSYALQVIDEATCLGKPMLKPISVVIL